ncbi:MAG: TonB-dependent receptor, partial [Limisphaerales bacterium]
ACANATHLFAQSNIQSQVLAPVTITGTPASDIPQVQSVAATALSGIEIEKAEINNTRDLTARTPNFAVFDANNDRSPRFSLRGFRENNFAAGSPVVGMYIDDIPYFDLYSRGVPLFDVERVEFLRGSQETMYGASGMAGVMNIATTQANNDWHGHAQAGYGNYDNQDYRAGIFGPIVKDKLFIGVSGIYDLRDGFVYNNTTKSHPDYRDTLAGKLTLTWTPSDPWSFSAIVHAERFNDGFVPTFVPGFDKGPFSVFRDQNGFVDTDAVNEAFKIAYTSPDFTVSSVTTHRDWRQTLLQDFDFTAFPIVNGFSNPQLEQWGEELRIQSPADADKLHWLGGLYWLNQDNHTDTGSFGTTLFDFGGGPVPVPFTQRTLSRMENNTYAAFGQATYNVWRQLDLTAGVRLTYDDRQMQRRAASTFGGFPTGPAIVNSIHDHFSAVQPKVAGTWHFTPELETYASVTLGHQPGGFNASQDVPSKQEYGATRSWQFELGAKSSWLDNRVHADAALFYTETHGYQVFAFNPTNPAEAFVLNAQRASSFGAELDLTANPCTNLELTLNVGYTYGTYDRFTDPNSGLVLDGNRISFVPEFTANFSAKYRLPFHLYIQGEVQALGTYYLDETESMHQDPFALVNAQFGYEIKNLEVYVFAKNIFDQHYANNSLDLRSKSSSGSVGEVLQPGDPLTFGFAVNAKF